MIAFASLILSLAVGPQTVDLLVGDGVVAAEVRLDGETLERLEGPPWRAVVDLGPELAPARLEAVAFGPDGGEIGRAEQWLNLPRRAAEISVVLEGAAAGRGAVARIAWRNLFSRPPEEVRVHLDGRPLPVGDPERVELPAFDPAALHLLRVEVVFPDGIASTADVTFGGSFGDTLTSELTAVPVVLDAGTRPPGVAELARALRLDGRAPDVLAVEEGPVELVAVLVESARRPIAELAAAAAKETRTLGALPGLARLEAGHRLRFVDTRPRRLEETGYAVRLFPASEVFDRRDGGLLWLFHEVRPKAQHPGPERVADAVAAAALAAARQNRRRAVLLVTGSGGGADASQFGPGKVRRYLERLRVPLVVWRVGPAGEGASPWGAAEQLASPRELAAAYRRLARELERQRVVWLRGAHVPQRIELAPAARGVRLAGQPGAG